MSCKVLKAVSGTSNQMRDRRIEYKSIGRSSKLCTSRSPSHEIIIAQGPYSTPDLSPELSLPLETLQGLPRQSAMLIQRLCPGIPGPTVSKGMLASDGVFISQADSWTVLENETANRQVDDAARAPGVGMNLISSLEPFSMFPNMR